MNRRTLITILLVVAFLALGYAIYRSTAPMTTVIVNNQPTVYNEPQHGLTLGLCLIAGICLLGAVYLADKEDWQRGRDVIRRDDRSDIGTRRTL